MGVIGKGGETGVVGGHQAIGVVIAGGGGHPGADQDGPVGVLARRGGRPTATGSREGIGRIKAGARALLRRPAAS